MVNCFYKCEKNLAFSGESTMFSMNSTGINEYPHGKKWFGPLSYTVS